MVRLWFDRIRANGLELLIVRLSEAARSLDSNQIAFEIFIPVITAGIKSHVSRSKQFQLV